jgi:hypothetical protein
MISVDNITSFYSIFVGVAAANIIVSWAKILKDYPQNKVSWFQLLWSLQFFFLLVWEWHWETSNFTIDSPLALLRILIDPIIISIVSYLVLPQTEDAKSFGDQKFKIAFLMVCWCVNKYLGNYLQHDFSIFEITTSRIQIALSTLFFAILAFDRRVIIWNIASLIDTLFLFTLIIGIMSNFIISMCLLSAIAVYFVFLLIGVRTKK